MILERADDHEGSVCGWHEARATNVGVAVCIYFWIPFARNIAELLLFKYDTQASKAEQVIDARPPGRSLLTIPICTIKRCKLMTITLLLYKKMHWRIP